MDIRTIETNVTVDPSSFEPILWLILRKNNTVIFAKHFILQLSGDYVIENHIDTKLYLLNNLLVEHGEAPLTTEEIVLYKLSQD